jgi:hypothetical protein
MSAGSGRLSELEIQFDEQRSVGRIAVNRTSARVPGDDARPRVLDLSPMGLKVRFPQPPSAKVVAIEVLHPSLPTPIAVECEVRWSRPEPAGKGTLLGLAFRALAPHERARLAQLIAHELGRRVLIGDSAVGFAATGGDAEGALFLYDGALKLRAAVKPEGKKSYRIERIGGETADEGKLLGTASAMDEAVRIAFDREGPVRFDPPLPK